MGQVAKDFDHTEIAVREWVKQAERDAGTRQDGGLTSSERAELRRWADTVLRQHYGGYELRGCWLSHIHGIWELSTLAAAWHHAKRRGAPRPGPRPGILRPLAPRHHAAHQHHHPHLRPRMRATRRRPW